MRQTKQPSLTRSIVVSAVLHFITILVILLFPSGYFMEPKPEPKIVWVELPKGREEDIMKVKEVKRLPEKPIEEEVKPIKPLDKKVMPEPEVKKKKVVEKKKVVKKSRMDRALAKIDKRLQEREAAQVKTKAGYEHGTSDEPLKDQDYHAALLKYRAQVRAKILRNWIPPSVIKTLPSAQRPVVKITVFISKGGDVLSTRWAQKSNSEAMNQSAMRAVRRASPFPIPPDPLKWEAYNEGFSVVFNPRSR